MNATQRVSIPERARRYLATLEPLCRAPDNPQDSHGELFKAACVLVHGFALSEAEAFPLLREYANRSDLPWSDHEVNYKVRSANRATHPKPRGHLLEGSVPPPGARASGGSGSAPPASVPPRPVYSARKLACGFDPAKLRGMAGKWREVVTVEWLANRSVCDLSEVGPRRYLEMLYATGEQVLCFTVFKSQGQAFWPKDEVPQAGPDGVWYLAQPVNGLTLPNPRNGQMSRRSQESVTAFRYLVLESDEADMSDWLALLVQLPLRIEAIYTSGGKSVHALVRVDCPTHRAWEEYVQGMMPTLNLLGMAGVDPKALTSVRLTRLPGCLRGSKLQKLLYLRPGAAAQPICEVAAGLDVTARWLREGDLVLEGHGEPTRELRRGLEYYAGPSRQCREMLREIEALPAEAHA